MAEMFDVIGQYEACKIDFAWDELGKASNLVEGRLRAFDSHTTSGLMNLHRAAVHEKIGGHLWDFVPTIEALSLKKQRALLAELRPTDFRDGIHKLKPQFHKFALGEDFRAMLTKAKSAKAFVSKLSKDLTAPTVSKGGRSDRLILLAMLRNAGLVLFPLGYPWLKVKSSYKWLHTFHERFIPDPLRATLERLTEPMRVNSGTGNRIPLACVLATSVRDESEFFPELLSRLKERALVFAASRQELTSRRLTDKGKVNTTYELFIQQWNVRHPLAAVKILREVVSRNARGNGEFVWIEEKNPRLEAWPPLLRDYIKSLPLRTKASPIARMNTFGDYLVSLENPPLSPKEVERAKHITDPKNPSANTFFSFLAKQNTSARLKSWNLSRARNFFTNLIAAQHSLAPSSNPLLDTDRFVDHRKKGGQKTHRKAIPGWLLREMRRTLEEDDYAIARRKRSHRVRVTNQESGRVEHVWSPAVAHATDVLLTLPFRQSQVLWLDSGEADEFIVEGDRFVQNQSLLATKGRKEGFLTRVSDGLNTKEWIGGYVNTSKTDRTFTIPWLPDHVVKIFNDQRDWNRKYLPTLAALVKYEVRENDEDIDPNLLTDVHPLFRNPRPSQRDKPISGHQVKELLIDVCAATEKRLALRGLKVQLTKMQGKKRVLNFDLHSLRVSGITFLLERGVPLDIVCDMVAGHASIVMTLHYFARLLERTREVMVEAYEVMEEPTEELIAQLVKKNQDDARFLLSQGYDTRATTSDIALVALNENKGFWTIYSDGMCPGTDCASGGEQVGDQFMPVRGGKCCPLCRYWLTGPAFLVGQVAEFNALVYRMRSDGLELKAARETLAELEDAGNLKKAAALRSRVDAMNKTLAILVDEFVSRHEYIESSSALLDEYIARNPTSSTSALITSSDAGQLRVTLEKSSSFMLLETVTQMARFVPGFKCREASKDKQAILAKMLARNGIDQFIYELPDESAEAASNLLSALVIKYAKAMNKSKFKEVPGTPSGMTEEVSNTIDQILSGSIPLHTLPPLRNGVEKLKAAAISGKLNERKSLEVA